MARLILSVDRREADRDAIVTHAQIIEKVTRHLQVEVLDEEDYEEAEDSGAYRDFVPVAILIHPDRTGLEYVVDDLIERWGWLIDFRPPQG